MQMKTIVAAGGLVTNKQHELMMIYRRGFWDLPKGKLDEGEHIEACAIREVEEETGAKNIQLGNLIGKTYHHYFDKWMNENVVKETWWYAMEVLGLQELVPQTVEDIEQIKWIQENELPDYLSKSYPTIVEIINKWKQ